jgi:hypothetical protein
LSRNGSRFGDDHGSRRALAVVGRHYGRWYSVAICPIPCHGRHDDAAGKQISTELGGCKQFRPSVLFVT